jgi:hypothetical protein
MRANAAAAAAGDPFPRPLWQPRIVAGVLWRSAAAMVIQRRRKLL